MIVLDQEQHVKDSTGAVLSWRSYVEDENVTSIPRTVERHAARLRSKYIAFTGDVGQSLMGGRRVVEHLRWTGGFSFWWMTKIAEKSPFKSRRVFDCLRMMALEEILIERRPPSLELRSVDAALADAMRSLCRGLSIPFTWVRLRAPSAGWSLRRVYDASPSTLQGLLSLRHILLRWPLRQLGTPQWFSGGQALFLCSNFAHLDPVACDAGRFHSFQWGALPTLLRELPRKSNWIHHFLHRPSDVSAETGLAWIRGFNCDAGNQGYHAYLESFLSPGVVLRALRSWLRLCVTAFRLRGIHAAFKVSGSAVWLWPLLKADWRESLCGPTAISNCMWVELFEAVLSALPRQPQGLYLWENQAWECALVSAWRRNGHGKIMGVPHSTVPFWYLNIYDDARVLAAIDDCAKPVPDALAVNGRMARNALSDAGYPADRLIDVEALRFHYLTSRGAAKVSTAAASRSSCELLVLGDYTLAQTLKMLACVDAARALAALPLHVTLKPHPTCVIPPKAVPNLEFALTDRPLGDIIRDFDFAFCSNSTSAGLDALLAGVAVAVFLDDEDFNHSPLRGMPAVRFVSTGRELAAVLATGEGNEPPPAAEAFFWLDDALPRWRRLLDAVPTGTT